ncbi:MAG: tripartite tricarboxylate transporter substrate binding protein [Burkholderiales bacterium]
MGRYLSRIAILLAFVAIGPSVNAQTDQYPEKPIRIVSPFPPGGANDIIARMLATRLSANFGRPVVVENKPGAAGGIGSALVAKAEADGYSLVMGTLATHGINPSIYKSLQYDVLKDFAPVAMVASIPIVLTGNPAVQARDVKSLLQVARQSPGKLNFASSGVGSVNHLAGELFKSMARVEIVHVPYKGSAPALVDLLGGQVRLMFDLLPSSLAHIQSGKLKAFAVTTATRSTLLPNVPTMVEAGLKGYDVSSWFGVFAPSGTPKGIVEKLNAEIVRVLRTKSMRDQMLTQGAEPTPTSTKDFGAVVRRDLGTWAKVVKDLGISQ